MITITITRTTIEKYVETVNFPVKETPTDYKEDDYNNRKKVVLATEYQAKDVTKSREIKRTLVQQEIEADDDFNLAAVLKAINNL